MLICNGLLLFKLVGLEHEIKVYSLHFRHGLESRVKFAHSKSKATFEFELYHKHIPIWFIPGKIGLIFLEWNSLKSLKNESAFRNYFILS